MKIAVVGATLSAGREILSVMAERDFPVESIVALDDREALGREVSYGEDDVLKVGILDDYNFAGTDIAVFAAGEGIASRFVPKAAKAGCIVIDTSSEFALEPDVPLIAADINPEDISRYQKKKIIAAPAPSVVQLLTVVKPLADAFGLKRATVTALEAVSNFGKEAMDELFDQTRGIYMNAPISESKKYFTKQIAFNVIPFAESFMSDGALRDEWKIASQSEKILGSGTKVTANCAVAPVFIGSSQYVNMETKKPVDISKAREVLRNIEGITLFDHKVEEGYITPAEVPGEDNVYVSRLRKDTAAENGLSFFSAADAVHNGIALNAAKIVEILVDKYLS
ncbi:MAG: aspartate-semialdehyde dehydrogenase [Alphaproteobacteria bacterium]|nr:aspartate-semialdehyde dehydrogenase [Alphaproteobacteria bacterium]